MLCSVCGSSTTTLRFHLEQYPVFDCGTCRHRFTQLERPLAEHLATTYSDAYFTQGGAGYPSYLDAAPIHTKHAQGYLELLAHLGITGGSVLDVGCAAGFHLHQFVRQGWHGLGVEPNPTLAGFAKGELGLQVVDVSIERLGELAPAARPFTLILMIQVLAHFVEPRKAFANAVARLQEGGHVLIETWDYRSLTARLFGRLWHEYSPPSVLQWFCRQSLLRLFQDHGLVAVAWGRPKKRLHWRHAQSLVEYKLPAAPRRLFRRLTSWVPSRIEIPYPGDDLLWVIARKPPSHSDSGRLPAPHDAPSPCNLTDEAVGQ